MYFKLVSLGTLNKNMLEVQVVVPIHSLPVNGFSGLDRFEGRGPCSTWGRMLSLPVHRWQVDYGIGMGKPHPQHH